MPSRGRAASTPAPGTKHDNEEGRVFPFDALPPLAELLKRQRERTTALERERAIINHASISDRPCTTGPA